MREIAANSVVRMDINLENNPSVQRLVDETELFLTKGDLEPKTFTVVSLNPTLLTLDNKLWQVRRENYNILTLLKHFYLFLFLDSFSY